MNKSKKLIIIFVFAFTTILVAVISLFIINSNKSKDEYDNILKENNVIVSNSTEKFILTHLEVVAAANLLKRDGFIESAYNDFWFNMPNQNKTEYKVSGLDLAKLSIGLQGIDTFMKAWGNSKIEISYSESGFMGISKADAPN